MELSIHLEKEQTSRSTQVRKAEQQEWLRKHGISVPPPPLSPEQVSAVHKIFKLLDEDNSGAIQRSELVKAFGDAGVHVPRCQFKEIMQRADANADGGIEFHEFLPFMARTFAGQIDGQANFLDALRVLRRKRLLEGVVAGGEERQKVVECYATGDVIFSPKKATPCHMDASNGSSAVTKLHKRAPIANKSCTPQARPHGKPRADNPGRGQPARSQFLLPSHVSQPQELDRLAVSLSDVRMPDPRSHDNKQHTSLGYMSDGACCRSRSVDSVGVDSSSAGPAFGPCHTGLGQTDGAGTGGRPLMPGTACLQRDAQDAVPDRLSSRLNGYLNKLTQRLMKEDKQQQDHQKNLCLAGSPRDRRFSWMDAARRPVPPESPPAGAKRPVPASPGATRTPRHSCSSAPASEQLHKLRLDPRQRRHPDAEFSAQVKPHRIGIGMIWPCSRASGSLQELESPRPRTSTLDAACDMQRGVRAPHEPVPAFSHRAKCRPVSRSSTPGFDSHTMLVAQGRRQLQVEGVVCSP